MYDPLKVDLAKVVGKLALLGAIVGINLVVLITSSSSRFIPLHFYVFFAVVFHTLEFMSTYLYNTSQVDDDSFILEDLEVLAINIASIIEFCLRSYFGITYNTNLVIFGVCLVVAGQAVRTCAMVSAGESFNHYIQRSRNDTHKLVTTGIYSIFRHPSYFGFFWWFVGMQITLNNIALLVIGCVILHRFFRKRIAFEEAFLVKFFKDDYVDYRNRVRTWIPWIR